MAPHVVANGASPTSGKDINILVTGFCPFQDKYPVNPSYEITQALPSTLPAKTTDGRTVNIIGYKTPIRVSYEAVQHLVPKLHSSYFGSVDLVLHIGMASGRDYYTAEIYAHRDGYSKNKDLDGKTLPADDGQKQFPDCPSMMTTSLGYDDIVRKWKSNITKIPDSSPAFGADCRASEDAGHYLCDYIYFNSLAWYGRRNGKLDGGDHTDRPVLFLHVPSESDPEMIDKGCDVTLSLIDAMVDDWCRSRTGGLS